ncbi:MAG: hypothetical protein IIA70_03080 [Proteobacteria bacterium]|nr:hypothetical protein [Pseudomonadota bacterium]
MNQHGGRREGAGRPPKYSEATIPRSISVPEDLDAMLIEDARLNKCSVNEIIIGNLNLIFDFMENNN